MLLLCILKVLPLLAIMRLSPIVMHYGSIVVISGWMDPILMFQNRLPTFLLLITLPPLSLLRRIPTVTSPYIPPMLERRSNYTRTSTLIPVPLILLLRQLRSISSITLQLPYQFHKELLIT